MPPTTRSAPPPQAQAALVALRERFRAAAANTFQAFERMAGQLTHAPTAAPVLEELRRELHRVHGTAGSYGYMEASRLAAKLEERVMLWARDPELDRDERGTVIHHFVGALRLSFDADDRTVPEVVARRRVVMAGVPPALVSLLRVEGVLQRWGLEVLAPEACTAAHLREQAPHVLLTTAALAPIVASEAAPAGVPIVALGAPAERDAPDSMGDAQRAAITFVDAASEPAVIVELVERLAARSMSAGATILVVDDDPSILTIVRYLVEADGTRVLTLDDPARLDDMLREARPSLLLMDVQMRTHDGIALVRALRERPEGRELPLILFSTEVDASVRQRAYDAGADEFIPKPLVPAELRARIRARLERQRLSRLAAGLHPGIGLPLPARTARDAAAFLARHGDGTAMAVALLRPAAGDAGEAVAWLREAQRIAAAMRAGFAGLHDGTALLVAMPQDGAGLAERLGILAAGSGAVQWRAGVVATTEVGSRELSVLAGAATDALEMPGAPGTRVARWTREAADIAPDVVVVEDDEALSDMLQFALRSAGYTYRAFRSGPEALDGLLRMRARGRRPLVLMDVDLPGMDGHSLHERLRSERPGAFAVVFVTVHGAEGEQIRALRSGALDWVTKPLSMRVLIAKIPIWLGYAARG